MERRRILVVAAALIAVLGVVLVLVYVKGSNNRAQSQYSTVPVLVATQAIAQGESYSAASAAGKLTVKQVMTTDKVAGAEDSTTGIDKTEVAQSDIYPGEQIIAQNWVAPVNDKTAATPSLDIPEGDVAISVSLTDPERVAGFVEPGSSVAIFVTSSSADASGNVKVSGAQARVLLPSVLVLGVGSTPTANSETADPATTGAAGTAPAETLPNTLLTLAVNQQEAEKILLATGNSSGTTYTLALGLLNSKSKIAQNNIVDSTNLFTGK
jgi:pilus assembly protein CpaB